MTPIACNQCHESYYLYYINEIANRLQNKLLFWRKLPGTTVITWTASWHKDSMGEWSKHCEEQVPGKSLVTPQQPSLIAILFNEIGTHYWSIINPLSYLLYCTGSWDLRAAHVRWTMRQEKKYCWWALINQDPSHCHFIYFQNDCTVGVMLLLMHLSWYHIITYVHLPNWINVIRCLDRCTCHFWVIYTHPPDMICMMIGANITSCSG